MKLLDSDDVKVVNVCLDALEHILQAGGNMADEHGINQMATFIEEANGVEKIQNLQYHIEEGGCVCAFLLVSWRRV